MADELVEVTPEVTPEVPVTRKVPSARKATVEVEAVESTEDLPPQEFYIKYGVIK